MRFHTHDRMTKIKTKKSVHIMLAAGFGLMAAIFLFLSVVLSLYIRSIMPAILILSPLILLAVCIAITQKDMDKAFVEITNGQIYVSDSYFGIKKEKRFSAQAVHSAEILPGSSLHVRGLRYGIGGFTYIVFRDPAGKYLFKVLCVPETKQFFGEYLNPARPINTNQKES